ncbi:MULTISPECIES: ATP-binding protein [unclassified Mycobacterium]|uniref:ATP-binding protein n=1 Tax=unclassified Mycobacterium TaxID=2642494 RepID=UPI0029C814F2|nr:MULTISPECIES: AAA family ATPase [unclassified Mycobacterium]
MLYGRGRECAHVADLLAAARDGQSGALVLRGEAGIGKSALLAHAVGLADGMRVLQGTGIETESDLPFAGVHRLLRQLHDLVDRLPSPQHAAWASAFGDGPAVVADRWLLSLAVLNLLAEAAATAPVLCVVDDAQWLDSASADALTFVARRVHAEGIAMLFAARDDPLRPFAASGLPELRVTGLDADAADALLAERAHVPVAASVRDKVLSGTLGNPLALTELAETLTATQLDGSAPLPDRLPVGADVEQLFGDRVRRHPADTQTLLLVAAANDSDDLDTVLRAARELGVAPDALDAAERDGLVTVDAGTLAFRHPLVRSAVYRGASSHKRRAVEHALAEVLDGARDGDRRAWHRANAATGPDDEVASALATVAQRAGDRGGHAAASAAFERSAELTVDADERAGRLTSAAEAAWLAGKPDAARLLLDKAAPATTHTRLRGRIAALRGSIEMACGAPAAAYATLVDGANLISETDPEGAGAMLAEAGQIAWGTGDLPGISQAGDQLAALPGTDNPGARTIIGLAKFMHGDTTGATRELAAAVELARDFEVPHMVMLAAAGAMFVGQDSRAIDLFTRAVVRTRSAGAAATLPTLLAPLAAIEMFTGRYVTARTTATEGLRLATETGQENPAAHARSVLAWLAAVQGRDVECVEFANAAIAHAIGLRLGPHAAIATWALAHLDLASGRAEQAYDRLQALAAAAPGEGNQMVSMFATADLVDAATRTGREASVAPALARLDVWAATTAAPWTHALVTRCHAQLTADDDESDRLFTESLALHASGGRPFDMARTALLFGERLRRRRKRAEARKHLRTALETFERLGATPWAEHARSELQATGETARKRDVSTLTELTPQELQIARLVAGGATNRTIAGQLFLSPRTVDYHLRKVFSKLGLSSRHELVRLSLHDEALAPDRKLA